MAKACGIHLEAGRLGVVLLEGSSRNPRVVAWKEHSFASEPEEDEGAESVAGNEATAVLEEFLKEHGVTSDGVGLAVDSGLAAFRTLSVPFADRAKIEEVIKFEVEGELPQWSIDDVVVDFLITSSTAVESQLIATAIPKSSLAERLAILERAGFEAQDAELDATALFEAAAHAEVLDPEAAEVLVHVSATSATVVVVDGEALHSIRAVQGGSSSAERLRREVLRTISGAETEHPFRGVIVSGADTPGLLGEPIEDLPVSMLELDPGAEDGAGLPSTLAPALGAALRRLGAGRLSPSLRREDLRLTGTFERLEYPVAILLILLAAVLASMFIATGDQLRWRDEGDPANSPGDMQRWLAHSNYYMLPNPKDGWPGRLKSPPKTIKDYALKAEAGGDETRSKYQEIRRIRLLLSEQTTRLQKDLGQVSEVVQPQSALTAACLVMGLVEDLGANRIGRVGVRELDANYRRGSSREPDRVEVKLDMDFLAASDLEATRNYTNFVNTTEAEPWCLEFERKPTKVLEGGIGIQVDGITITVDLTKIEGAQ